MIIITNANGDSITSVPENIYQGSNKANSIYWIAPIPSSSVATISFVLPNGEQTTEQLGALQHSNLPQGYEDFSMWSFDIYSQVTKYAGTVKFQLYAVTTATEIINNEETEVINQIIASVGGSFMVNRGVVPILPLPTIEDPTLYNQIKNLLVLLQTKINTGDLESKAILPYDENFTYSFNAVCISSDNKFYKSKLANNTGHELTNITWWEYLDFATGGDISDLQTQITANRNDINTINGKIPSNASSSNKMAVASDITTLQSTKQDKTDNSLQTTNKTVVGAINELNTGLASKVDKQVTSYNNQGTHQVYNTNTGSGLRWNYAGYENEVEVTNQYINIKSQQQSDDVSQVNIKRNEISLSSSDGDLQTTELVITKDNLKVNNQSLVSSIELSINPTTYVLSLQPKDFNGNNIGTAQTVDLPLESIVAGATYYNTYTYQGVTYQKVIVLTYTTTDVPTIVPVGDLVSGLQTEITPQNKLSADLVDDTNATNKFITNTQATQITTNANNISTLQGQVVTNTQDITKLQFQHLTITLNASDWSSNTQTKTVSTITGNSMIWVSATPTSIVDYTNAGIIATAQGSGTLTFTCNQTPNANIEVNLIINNAPNTGTIQTNSTLIINSTSDTITQVGNRLRIGGTN